MHIGRDALNVATQLVLNAGVLRLGGGQPDRRAVGDAVLVDRDRAAGRERHALRAAALAGTELMIALPAGFTKEFSQLSADQFIEDILVGRFAAEHVVIGENFNFGFKAQGTPAYLSQIGPKYGFGVTIVKLQENRGSTISSTRIRSLIIDGEIERANEMLTRNFYLKGPVVHGEKRGREIGYPTANIGLDSLATIPADGVYAGWLTVGKDKWPAAISIGTNPTFPGVRGRQVEAYALDQTGLDLYDKEAKLEFGFRLRDTLKFDGLDPLLVQMKKDCDKARELTSK